MLARALSEDAPQGRDVLVEAVLLHHDVRPDGLQQRGLVEELSAPLDEVEKSVELLRRQRDRATLRAGQQQSLLRIQSEVVEFVLYFSRSFRHHTGSERITTDQVVAKDSSGVEEDSTHQGCWISQQT